MGAAAVVDVFARHPGARYRRGCELTRAMPSVRLRGDAHVVGLFATPSTLELVRQIAQEALTCFVVELAKNARYDRSQHSELGVERQCEHVIDNHVGGLRCLVGRATATAAVRRLEASMLRRPEMPD